MRTLVLAAVSMIASAMAAAAAGAPPQATGLLGKKWAIDCSQPPSSTNYYLEYSIADDGRLVETLTSSRIQARKVSNIQLISKEWLLYTMDDDDGEAVNILTSIDERGRNKTWWSVGNNGKAYVVDGKFPDKDNGPPWFERCD